MVGRSSRASRRCAGFWVLGGALAAAPAAVAATSADAPRPGRPIAVVSVAERHDLSPPLRLIPAAPPAERTSELALNLVLPNRWRASQSGAAAAGACYALGSAASAAPMPSPLIDFEGVANRDSRVPPDTVADVGLHHVVQWVNLSFAIWDKSGRLLYGPVEGNTLWSGFGGICETNNNGDPIVLYDALANRWLMSQLAFDWPQNFHECIAISATDDPTGAWYRYDFPYSPTTLNDYPKFAVWPDAYYMAVNQYDGATQAYLGQGAVAFERDKMLVGATARMILFDLFNVNPNYGGQLPADLDGPVPPPDGAPAYFVEVDDDAWGWPTDRLQIWRFHVDWNDPSQSTFGVAGNPDSVVDLAAEGYAFDSNLCNYGGCVPQPAGGLLDTLSDRLMWRLAYRNSGTGETLTLSHTVDVDGTDHAGVRWYEVGDPGGPSPFVEQGGTYAPDGDHRWMGSVAMDGAGDLAVGYSVSGTSTYPSIRYAGRVASDPPGTLPRAEATLIGGSGAQTGAARWGDYSSMSVDPADDCTFWYTQEYYATTGPYPWQTRIGAFKFDACGTCPLVGLPEIAVDRETPGIRVSWSPAANAGDYDVVEGDLVALRASGGDFASAVTGCKADDVAALSIHLDEPDPAPGGGFWYLVRGERNGCRGSLDEPPGPRPPAPRDAGIGASPSACP